MKKPSPNLMLPAVCILFFLAATALVLLHPLLFQRRIHMCFPSVTDCRIEKEYTVGKHRVTLGVVQLIPGDNGPVEIEVRVNGKAGATIRSQFDFDTLSDMPPGYTKYKWIDGDIYPDLLIIPWFNKPRYVSSKSGFVVIVDGTQ